MPKRKSQILEYDNELFIPWCHYCFQPTELIVVGEDVRSKCCHWFIGKKMDEDYKKQLLENGSVSEH
jgi:hypothetical protein